MPAKQPALTLSKLMRLVSPPVVGAVGLAGWLVVRGDIRRGRIERQRESSIRREIFSIVPTGCRTPYVRRPLVSPCISMCPPNVSSWINRVFNLAYLLYTRRARDNVEVVIALQTTLNFPKAFRDVSPPVPRVTLVASSWSIIFIEVYTLYMSVYLAAARRKGLINARDTARWDRNVKYYFIRGENERGRYR